MRDIKFRGQRADNKEWITGSETFIRDGDGIWLSDENGHVEKVDEKTVGQYAGFEDKNGVEIYEGDKLTFGTTDDGRHIDGIVLIENGTWILKTDFDFIYKLSGINDSVWKKEIQ